MRLQERHRSIRPVFGRYTVQVFNTGAGMPFIDNVCETFVHTLQNTYLWQTIFN